MADGVVTFDVAAFRVAYPTFTDVPDATLQAYFDEAGLLYLDNSAASPVSDLARRQVLLWLLVAHLATLRGGSSGSASSGLVGRITSASEGSVSVSAELPSMSAAAAFFTQTPYGFQYWQAMSPYRRFKYVPGRSYPLLARLRFGGRPFVS